MKLIKVKCSDADEEIEITYRIPSKGGFKRKTFKSQSEADKFVDALMEKEGNDVEIRWGS